MRSVPAHEQRQLRGTLSKHASPRPILARHTSIFVVLILGRATVIAANFFEAPVVTAPQKAFLAVHTAVSLLSAIFLSAGVTHFERTGEILVRPVWIVQTIDYLWFALTGLCTWFIPSAPGLVFHTDTVELVAADNGPRDADDAPGSA